MTSTILGSAQPIPNTIQEILNSIDRNNSEIKTQQQQTNAMKFENSSQNNMSDPTVNYSSFYSNSSEGGHGTELVATQGFDFPTQYIARNRRAKLQNEALDLQHYSFRREILLNAKKICLDLVMLNKEQKLMKERGKRADELMQLYEKRLSTGDANILEVNKVKMERMNVQADIARNNAAHRTALQQLLAMNNNMPLEFDGTEYPTLIEIKDADMFRDEVIGRDLDLQSAEFEIRAADKDISVNKQGWLPKLEVGFRRNTSIVDAENGFVVGGSLPLFENRKKVSIAKAKALSAKLKKESMQQQKEGAILSMLNEMKQLDDALKGYDVKLMYSSLELLEKSLVLGQISLIEYFVEAEAIYSNLQSYMQLENQYQKLMADLYKNSL